MEYATPFAACIGALGFLLAISIFYGLATIGKYVWYVPTMSLTGTSILLLATSLFPASMMRFSEYDPVTRSDGVNTTGNTLWVNP